MKLLFFLIFAGVGLSFIIVAIPLVRRRVKPNHWYGLRVPATFADEWVWYEANAASGRDLIQLGLVQMAVATVLALIPGISDSIYVAVNAAVLAIGAVTMAGVGIRRANRLLRERRRASSTPLNGGEPP